MPFRLFPRTNKKFSGVLKASHWRRLSSGSWAAPNDPTIYAAIEINIEPALAYLEKIRAVSGERITITHFIGKVWGILLRMHPEMNSELRFGRFYQRAGVSISFQVAIDKEEKTNTHNAELSTGIVRNIDQKSLPQIAHELNKVAHRIRTQDDPEYKAIKKSTRPLPGFLFPFLIRILKFILNTLNLWTPLLGVPRDSFGGLLITNVGSIGLDWAFPALFPPANAPGIVAIGAIYKEPLFECDADGVVIRTRLARHVRMCGAFDHRYVDGLHASKMAREMRKIFADPEKYSV